MEKAFVAQAVATKLFAAENSVDAALTNTSALLAGLLEARQELQLSATAGNEVAAKVAEAIAALASARTAMVSAHADLDSMKSQLGIRTKLIGVQEKPASSLESAPTLRVVG